MTDIQCTGQGTSTYASDYTAPNSISYDFSSGTAVAETNVLNGCAFTTPNSLAYAGTCGFTATPDSAITCSPTACSAICGQTVTTVTTWSYSVSGTTLTMSMTNALPGVCPANVQTVITLN